MVKHGGEGENDDGDNDEGEIVFDKGHIAKKVAGESK